MPKKKPSPKKSVAPPLRPADFKIQPKPVVEPEPLLSDEEYDLNASPPTDPLTDLLTRVGLAVAWLDHHGLTNTDCWFILKKIQKDYGEEKE